MIKSFVTKASVKYLGLSFMAAAFAILWLSSPVLAYDPPAQDATANATDVILWGDNVTITLEIPDDVNIVTDGDVEISGASDFFDNIFLFVVIAGVTAYVTLTKSIFGKIVVSPLLVTYGLRLAIPETVFSIAWMAGVVIALVGTGLVFRVIWDAINPYVTKMLKMLKGKGNEDE